jgi:hypothetical protein
MTCVSLDCMRGRRRWLAWPTTRVCYILLKTITKYQRGCSDFLLGSKTISNRSPVRILKKGEAKVGHTVSLSRKNLWLLYSPSPPVLSGAFSPAGLGVSLKISCFSYAFPTSIYGSSLRAPPHILDSIWGHVFHVVSVLDVLTVFRTSEFEVDNGGEWASTARGLLLWSASSGATTSSREPPVPW